MPVKVRWPNLVAKDDPIEDLQETYRLLFPGKDVKALMFVSGKTGKDKNNVYLSQVSKETGWPALYYSRPEQSADEVEKMVREGGFLGTKSYLNLAPPISLPRKSVFWTFSPITNWSVSMNWALSACVTFPEMAA